MPVWSLGKYCNRTDISEETENHERFDGHENENGVAVIGTILKVSYSVKHTCYIIQEFHSQAHDIKHRKGELNKQLEEDIYSYALHKAQRQ